MKGKEGREVGELEGEVRKNRKERKEIREEGTKEKRRGTIPNNFLTQYLTIKVIQTKQF